MTDIEGSTALSERLGDAKAREVLREHERIVREQLAAHGGREVKTMGDGFMVSLGSATKALEGAVAIQKAFEEQNTDVGASWPSTPRSITFIRIRSWRVSSLRRKTMNGHLLATLILWTLASCQAKA